MSDEEESIGVRLLPVMQAAASMLRAFLYNSWPGMPYTKPSLWAASQMAADRGSDAP